METLVALRCLRTLFRSTVAPLLIPNTFMQAGSAALRSRVGSVPKAEKQQIIHL